MFRCIVPSFGNVLRSCRSDHLTPYGVSLYVRSFSKAGTEMLPTTLSLVGAVAQGTPQSLGGFGLTKRPWKDTPHSQRMKMNVVA